MRSQLQLILLLQIFCLTCIKCGDGALIGYVLIQPKEFQSVSKPENVLKYTENIQEQQNTPPNPSPIKQLTRRIIKKCNGKSMICLVNKFKIFQKLLRT